MIALLKPWQKELAKGSGAVAQITQVAKQHEADMVCAVSMTEAFGAYSISARIIKTSDSEVMQTASLERSLKSLDDLAMVSKELAAQLLGLPGEEAPPVPTLAPQPGIAAVPEAPVAVKKQCDRTYNINELLYKVSNGFPVQLKDCSSKLAKRKKP